MAQKYVRVVQDICMVGVKDGFKMEVRLYQRSGELLLGSNYDGQFDMFGEGEAGQS